MKPQLGKHGFDGACIPNESSHCKTFSLGFFKWEAKKSGGLKKGKSILRMRAKSFDREAALKYARRIVNELNDGWEPSEKSFTFKL